MDLIVTVSPNSDQTKANVYVFQHSGSNYKINPDFTIKDIRKQQPFMFTYYNKSDTPNDAKYDTYLLIDDGQGERFLYFNDFANTATKGFKKIKFTEILNQQNPKCLQSTQTQDKFMDPQASSSYIDMNADCRPDLLLITLNATNQRFHEYYLLTDHGFCLINVKSVSQEFSMPSFQDLNNRGTNDMVMVQKPSSTDGLRVHVFRNQYATDLNTEVCADTGAIQFPYQDFDQQITTSNKLVYDLKVPANVFLYNVIDYPPVIQLGDLNLDGLVDMTLVITQGDSASSKIKSHAYVLKNTKCADAELNIVWGKKPSTKLDKENCRYFNHTAFGNTFQYFESPITERTSYFDFGEIGANSLLSQQWNVEKQTSYIGTYFNFFNKSNYFLKAIAKTDKKEYGNAFVGANFIAVKTEVDGTKFPVSCNSFYLKIFSCTNVWIQSYQITNAGCYLWLGQD